MTSTLSVGARSARSRTQRVLVRMCGAVLALAACFCVGPATAGSPEPVTVVLTHGFSPGGKGVWVEGLAEAMLARSGGGSVYRYTGDTGVLTSVAAAGADGADHTIVVIFNWVPESAGVSNGPNRFYTQAAGAALASVLMSPAYAGGEGPSDLLSGRAVHMIGHSRGPSVISSAVQRLGAWGITIDHVTSHDAHPLDGTLDWPYNFNWSDETPVRWSNVTFADNYWRADGPGFIAGLNPDGIPLADTFDVPLSDSALSCCAYGFSHQNVHLWYHGTVDHADTICDGEECIDGAVRAVWFPDGWTELGFYYAFRGGGSQFRPAMPGLGTDPGEVPVLYNGGFSSGSWAGWSYHGGGGSGTIVSVSGGHALRLTEAASTFAHNYAWLPANRSALRMELNVPADASSGTLRVELEPFGGSAQTIAVLALAEFPAGVFVPQHVIVPASLLEQRVRLRLTYEAAPGASAVLIDNVSFEPHQPGDLNFDGIVDLADLLLLLAAWGACEGDCPPFCAEDINQDCSVDLGDLLALLANWG